MTTNPFCRHMLQLLVWFMAVSLQPMTSALPHMCANFKINASCLWIAQVSFSRFYLPHLSLFFAKSSSLWNVHCFTQIANYFQKMNVFFDYFPIRIRFPCIEDGGNAVFRRDENEIVIYSRTVALQVFVFGRTWVDRNFLFALCFHNASRHFYVVFNLT